MVIVENGGGGEVMLVSINNFKFLLPRELGTFS